MKKKLKLLLCCAIALSTFWLWSCKDEVSLIGNEIPVEKGKLSFILPMGGKKTVTYAGTIVGDTAEYEIKRLRIYWFKDGSTSSPTTDKLFKVFNYGVSGADQTIDLTNIDVVNTNNTTTATINVGEDHDPSKFYIVANVNGSSIQSDALLNVKVGITTRADFEDLVANNLQADPSATNGELVLIKTPLPMSILDNTTYSDGGYIAVPDPGLFGTVSDVHLKRRVARFDIINTADYSNFEITGIRIARAQKTGWLHDKPFAGTESWASATGNIFVDGSVANGPRSARLDDNHNGIFNEFEKDSIYAADTAVVAKAVFYLWPTTLSNSGTGTEITIEGKYYGLSPRMYKLNLPADVDIVANMLYKIKVMRVAEAQLTFELIVDHWVENDDEFPAESAGADVTKWGTLKIDTTTFNLDTGTNLEYEYSSADSIKVTIISEGTNLTVDSGYNHVTRIAIAPQGTDYLASDLEATQNTRMNSTTVMTYGAHYVTTHEIWLPPTDTPIEMALYILNATNPLSKKTFILKSNNYAKTGFKPIQVGNLIWAPVNVGATKLNPTTAFNSNPDGSITGNYYQWGRNTPFPYLPTTVASTIATQFSSAAAANASTAFQTNATNWLDHEDSLLWKGANAQGPCPPGWRVPTIFDFAALNTAATKSGPTNGWITYTISSNKLYFPHNGYRAAVTGAINNYAGNNTPYVLLWLSNTSGGVIQGTLSDAPYRVWASGTTGSGSYTLAIGDPGNSDVKARGLGIRAVRDVAP